MNLDIQEYISSGIIESYVLGATTPEESQELERLAKQYPKIRQAIEANRFALMEYVLRYKEDPPEELKEKVLEKLAMLEHAKEAKPLYVRFLKSLSPPLSIAVAASFALLISVVANLYLYQSWKKAQAQLRQAILAKQQMEYAFHTTQASYQQIQQDLRVLAHPAMRFVSLEGSSESAYPSASIWLYWNRNTKDIYLEVKNLPMTSSGKQYQLWSVQGEHVKDAGMISMKPKPGSIQKMKKVDQADAFVITLEKAGGVAVAEGPLYAKGSL
ncbi:MAG: anti-sigma factor [Bacteroidia bacterium]|nr:anti-sigma factor [Bacteroidia bacterium]